MEKSRSEILSEIQETLAGLKARIAEVEERLSALEMAEEPVPAPVEEDMPVPEEPAPEAPVEPDIPAESVDMDPIDISIDIEDMAPVEAQPAAPEAPAEEPAPEPEPAAPAQAAEPVPAEEPVPADEPAGELLLDGAPRSKANINDRQERHVRKSVLDVMGQQKCAWKTAMPGTPVKNVISAISLNDRVLFINTLFKEDPMAFQEAIAAFNSMSSFDEAEEYVRTNYPDWKLDSDLVFRLMMAVRRKLK